MNPQNAKPVLPVPGAKAPKDGPKDEKPDTAGPNINNGFAEEDEGALSALLDKSRRRGW